MNRKDLSVQDLAELLGQSRQNINTKLKKDNFSEQDLKKIAEVLDVKCEV
ncbi:helix-turn-helix domain-containing protein [Lysinibacillus sp. JNUCC 51]|nr:helix-turn-helix transcriptional regulator [Lysinibacillus sp. JNUCC-51]